MPVNTPHPEYSKRIKQWKRCRDAIEGEDAIKAGGEMYLPRLGGQDPLSTQTVGASAEYAAYRDRANFFSASGRTVAGLKGAVLRAPADRQVPPALDVRLESTGVMGQAFEELQEEALEQVIGVGRYGQLVDAPSSENGVPRVSVYYAENIINWQSGFVGEVRKPILIVLSESRVALGNDQFDNKAETVYRVLRLGFPELSEDEALLVLDGLTTEDISGPIYYVEVWVKAESDDDAKDSWVRESVTIPRAFGGKPFDEIPFVFFNPSGTLPSTECPPLLDLVNVNISHYKNSADLEHGLHFTALPTAWVAGFDPKATDRLRIGSPVAWVADDPQARAGFLEFSGAGLSAISGQMDSKEGRMAVLGARLLEESRTGVETAEAIRLRQTGEHSVLSGIANSVSAGLTQVLRYMAQWLGIQNTNSITLTLNTDFNVIGIDPKMLIAMMQAVQSGMMSWNTWFHNLKRGELYPEGITEEDEAALIAAGTPDGGGAEEEDEIEDESEEESEEDEE